MSISIEGSVSIGWLNDQCGFVADHDYYFDPMVHHERFVAMQDYCAERFPDYELNFFEANLRQALPAFGNNLITLEIGLFNILNFLDSDWGIIKTAGGGVFPTVNIARVTDATNGVPNFDYNGPTNDGDPANATFTENGDPRSSWQLQVSLRYEYGQGIF